MVNAPTKDTFPPSSVRDLKVFQNETNLVVTFTSPGDDFDEGHASRYLLFYEYISLTDNITVSVEVKNSDLISGSLTKPLEAEKKVTLVLPGNYFNQSRTQYSMHVQAMDEEQNYSGKSNIARLCNHCYIPSHKEIGDGLTAWLIKIFTHVVSAIKECLYCEYS